MEEERITASAAADGGQFGYSVSISGDAALVGAPMDDHDELDTGSAYVFRHNADFAGVPAAKEKQLVI